MTVTLCMWHRGIVNLNAWLYTKVVNSLTVNWVPLSVIMLLGTPNRYMISLMNDTTFAIVIEATGFTLIHFVNLSTATKMCVNSPLTFLNGPTRSNPHVKKGQVVWQNHLREGFIVRINLSDSRRSKNTINTHKYNTIYWSSNRNDYNLGSCISYIEEVWSQNYASGDKSEFAEAISLNS
jgi:hypothetical protein